MRVSIICVVWNRSLDKCSPWALFRQLSSRSWATVTLFFGLALHHYIQRVQNAAAGFVLKVGPRAHATQALHQLHWSPVEFRIQFKLFLIMHQTRPVLPEGNGAGHCRSAWTKQTAFPQDAEIHELPQLNLTCGQRAFSYAEPAE